jgi:hypothetical protein
MNLSPLETEAMDWPLRGEDPILEALRQQFAQATLRSRKMTGAGFYLTFDVPDDVARLQDTFQVKSDFRLGDVEAQVDSLKAGIGFLLWISGGKLDFLEAYTFDETWSPEIGSVSFGYTGGSRNFNDLRREWEPR